MVRIRKKTIQRFCKNCTNEFYIGTNHQEVVFCSRRCAAQPRSGENHQYWKGDKVGYSAVHEWVKKYLPKPKVCNRCNLEKKLDLSVNDYKYTRELENWEWICRSCHCKKDDNGGETKFKKGQIPWNLGKPGLLGDKNGMWGRKHSEATKELIKAKAIVRARGLGKEYFKAMGKRGTEAKQKSRELMDRLNL